MSSNDDSLKELARSIGIPEESFIPYGPDMAKLDVKISGNSKGKLILVTAMTPTTYGEGKTTTCIGLAQGIKKLGKKVTVCLREPSMGPVFGMKGGATGGGKSKIEPSNKINLMFTGDFSAVSSAHNLLSTAISNHIYFGNKLRIDPSRIQFPRTMDMNDRSLRNIILSVSESNDSIIYRDRFVITPASELMAILGLSLSIEDMKNRIGNILIGFSYDMNPVYCKDLNVQNAMAAILVDALKPNLVRTTEGVPALVHTGPFANIAHGTSSLLSTKIAMQLSEYVVIEAGFGSDLGAEKFMNIVSRVGNVDVSAVVLVVTIRGIKELGKNSNEVVATGFQNVIQHVENIRSFGYDPVVCLNVFASDSESEIKLCEDLFEKYEFNWSLSEAFAKGGDGTIQLAEKVLNACATIKPLYTYDFKDPTKVKIEKICKRVYGCSTVKYSKSALDTISVIEKFGFSDIPICVAKSQYSFSGTDDKNTIMIREIKINSGAGFIVPISGNIMTMPGLPREPAYLNIDVDKNGKITGIS